MGGGKHRGPGPVRAGEQRCREGRGPSETPAPTLSPDVHSPGPPESPQHGPPLGPWGPLLSRSSTDSQGGPEGAENSGVSLPGDWGGPGENTVLLAHRPGVLGGEGPG